MDDTVSFSINPFRQVELYTVRTTFPLSGFNKIELAYPSFLGHFNEYQIISTLKRRYAVPKRYSQPV